MQEYLTKHNLKTKEQIAQHIVELKRNTIPDFGLISSLCFYLFDGEKETKTVTMPFGREFLTVVVEKENHNKQRELNEHISEILKDAGTKDHGEVKSNSTRHKASVHCGGYDKPKFPLKKLEDGKNTVFVEEGTGFDYLKRPIKDDVITNINRGEKEIIEHLQGIKESQALKKAPIFTYCKVNRNAIEALSLRALYGHEKYEKGDDWENFSRVPNGDFEYSNAEFRHALNIGEEDEETHLVASAWNAVARLEIYLRDKLNKS